METFPALQAFCAGISVVAGESPHKGQWHGALMFSLTWNNNWANNGDAGDLRRHRANYDVSVIFPRSLEATCLGVVVIASFYLILISTVIIGVVLCSVFIIHAIPRTLGVIYMYTDTENWTNVNISKDVEYPWQSFVILCCLKTLLYLCYVRHLLPMFTSMLRKLGHLKYIESEWRIYTSVN